MHTPELSDEELDALFRQGAEHYPDELNLGAWSRMEQKLDAAHVQQLVNRKVARLFAAEMGIVALVLLIWGSYRHYNGLMEHVPTGQIAARAATQVPNEVSSGTSVRRAASTSRAAASQGAPNYPTAPIDSRTAAVPSEATSGLAQVEAAEAAGASIGATEAGATKPAQGIRVRPGLGLAPAAVTIRLPEPVGAAAYDEAATVTAARGRRVRRTTSRESPLAQAVVGSRMSEQEGSTQRQARRFGRGRRAVTSAAAATTRTDVSPSSATSSSQELTAKLNSGAGSRTARASVNGSAETGAAHEAALSAVGARQAAEPASVEANPAAAGAAVDPSAGAAAESLVPLPAALVIEAEALPDALTAAAPMRQLRPFWPSRIFIMGVYAPELSTVRNAGFTHPGRSAGVQVEYRLTSRLRLNVGLLSSVKYYHARGSDYKFAWTPAYPIDRIDATCRITDIPVNLRWDVWQGMRGRVFGAAGVSSLLMRDEQYQYTYQYNGHNYSRSWGVKKGKNHPFSVVNLSAGYEFQLSPRWSAQAEPFLKLPLGGVGAGSVRLSSGGVFLGLKYGL